MRRTLVLILAPVAALVVLALAVAEVIGGRR